MKYKDKILNEIKKNRIKQDAYILPPIRELCETLSLTKETINQELRWMQKNKYIKVERGTVWLIDSKLMENDLLKMLADIMHSRGNNIYTYASILELSKKAKIKSNTYLYYLMRLYGAEHIQGRYCIIYENMLDKIK